MFFFLFFFLNKTSNGSGSGTAFGELWFSWFKIRNGAIRQDAILPEDIKTFIALYWSHLLSSRRVFLFVSEIYSLLQKSIPLFWSSTEDITVWVWGWKNQSETKVAIFSFDFMVLTRKSHPLFQWTEILERTGINSLIFGWRKPSTCKNCIETSLFDLIFSRPLLQSLSVLLSVSGGKMYATTVLGGCKWLV